MFPVSQNPPSLGQRGEREAKECVKEGKLWGGQGCVSIIFVETIWKPKVY